MAYIIVVLGILALVAVAGTLAELRSDGYRRRPSAAISRQQHQGRWH